MLTGKDYVLKKSILVTPSSLEEITSPGETCSCPFFFFLFLQLCKVRILEICKQKTLLFKEPSIFIHKKESKCLSCSSVKHWQLWIFSWKAVVQKPTQLRRGRPISLIILNILLNPWYKHIILIQTYD